jgi:hypothetical protein
LFALQNWFPTPIAATHEPISRHSESIDNFIAVCATKSTFFTFPLQLGLGYQYSVKMNQAKQDFTWQSQEQLQKSVMNQTYGNQPISFSLEGG